VKNGANYTPYYYHADGLGSITGLSDATGTMVQTYGYDAFGNVTVSGSGNVAQPFMFTGREYDAETSMYFYRARYYDPTVGRFVTKDPIGFGGGDYNLYGYVGNNPINFSDPDGLFAQVIPPLLIYGPSVIATAWMAIKEIAKNPPRSESKCETKNDNMCDKMYDIDTATCNGISRARGNKAGARCHASASQRYAECLRFGPLGVRTPLDTWNN